VGDALNANTQAVREAPIHRQEISPERPAGRLCSEPKWGGKSECPASSLLPFWGAFHVPS
jgi:hypothetical protein